MDMDIHKAKMLQKLRGSYQIGSLLIPLIDATQRHRESTLASTFAVSPDALLKTVFDASNKVYQRIASKDELTVDTSFVLSSLNVAFSKLMRNNVVLYGQSSLDDVVEDVYQAFDKNLSTLQRWAGLFEKEISGGASTQAGLTRVEKTRVLHDVIGYVTTALMNVLSPFFLFHANLFLVARIDSANLQRLNRDCASYMIAMMDSMQDVLKGQQSDLHNYFTAQSAVLCSELCSMHCYELHSRLLKSNDDISKYIQDPLFFLEKIAPPIMSSFSLMNDYTLKIMSDLMQTD